MGMKHFALYCILLCLFGTLAPSMRLLQNPQLCTQRRTCQNYSRLTCTHVDGRLVSYTCVFGGTVCEYRGRPRCATRSQVSCQPLSRHCACSCGNTRTIIRRTTTQNWG
uniref:8.9 kDa family member n=1 Tax=Rhipicephalus zambeziensis TaxID=60191 RepID=A0A224YES0_9ACAR